MQKLLILFLFLFPVQVLTAQNYPIVNSLTNHYYSDSTAELRRVFVDSIYNDPFQTTYYTKYNNTYYESQYPCMFNDNGPSLLGYKIIKDTAGVFYLFNASNDTVTIKTLANTGEKWAFLKLDANRIITAAVDSVVAEPVLGTPDSVKHIRLMLEDSLGNSIPHILNNTLIKIAKEAGPVLIPDIFILPQKEIHQLEGTTPERGIINLTANVIYNYAVGDEFHYKGSSSTSYKGPDPYSKSNSYKINTILEKNQVGDTLIYKVERKFYRKTTHYHYPEVNESVDKTELIFDLKIDLNYYSFLNSISHEIHPRDFDMFSYNTQHTNGINGRSEKRVWNPFVYMQDSACYAYNNTFKRSTLTEEFSTYTEGLGLTSYNYNTYFPQSIQYDSLIYFKKGSEIWGSPIDWASVSVKETFNNAGLKVFPNPVKDFLTIETGLNTTSLLSIFNGTGQIVYQSLCPPGNSVINLASFPKGFYFLYLENEEGTEQVKFVK